MVVTECSHGLVVRRATPGCRAPPFNMGGWEGVEGGLRAELSWSLHVLGRLRGLELVPSTHLRYMTHVCTRPPLLPHDD